MCSIVTSFDKEKLKELYKLNAYRGEMSYSLSSFAVQGTRAKLNILMQDKGKLPDTLIDDIAGNDDVFFIAHSQAPTTEAGNMHPAVYGDAMLWHNGILKQKTIPENTWDTLWLLEQILYYGWSSLSRIDGTFACIMYNAGEVFVFRNEISPLFYDKNLNFSSTRFDGSESLEPNKVFRVDFDHKQLSTIAFFQTHENPYFFA